MRRRVCAVLLLAAVVVAVSAPAAGAIDLPKLPNCPPYVPDGKTPPVPASPDAGGLFAGLLMPDDVVHGDPFAPGATVSIVDQYGYGGLEWSTYDLGCGGATRDPFSATWTGIANQTMLIPVTLLQVVGSLGVALGDSAWVRVFDGPLEAISGAVKGRVLVVLLPLCALFFVIVALRNQHRQSLADLADDVGWVLLAVVSSAVLLAAPTSMARHGDEIMGVGMDAVRSTFGPAAGPLASVGPTHRDVLYNTWLAGEFGSAESPAAQKYGPDLFKAQVFSRDELARIGDDRGAYADAVKQKNEAWVSTAERVADEYPDAYVNLKGQRSGLRFLSSLTAIVKALAACLFVTWAGVAFALARFELRMFCVMWPMIGLTLGLIPATREYLVEMWNRLSGTIVRAIVGGFVAGVVSLMLGAIAQAPDTNEFTRLMASILVSWGAWRATRSFRQSGAMPGGRKWMRRLETFATAALGAHAGASIGSRPDPAGAELPPPPPAGERQHPGFDVHATERGGGSRSGQGSLPYRPAAIPSPGYRILDVGEVGGSGEHASTAREQTRHRKVGDHADHGSPRARPAAQPARHRVDIRDVRDAGDERWYDQDGNAVEDIDEWVAQNRP